MEQKEVLVPKLRFSEFNECWIHKPFKELTKINQGLQIPISERLIEQVEGCYFYITNEFLKEGSDKKYYIKNPSESVLCNEDDILMTRTGNTGMVVTNVSGAFHNNFFKIKYPHYINKDFLYYFLTLESTQNYIKRLAGTSTIPDLNHSDFYRIEMRYPSLQEQQKIAAFLSAVDTKIQQLERKKELLEQYKKGIMQQLFNQELRFKQDDGSNYPDWEEKRLKDVLIHKSVRNKELKYNLVLSVSNTKGFISQSEQFDGHRVASKDVSNYKIVKRNQFAYNPSRINVGSIAKLKDYEIGIVSPMYVIFEVKKEFDTRYIEFLTQIHLFKHFVKVGCSGSVRDSLNYDDLESFKFSFPTKEEQTKIANFLSAIDSKIELVNTQITQNQIFKKGLLQQMFV